MKIDNAGNAVGFYPTQAKSAKRITDADTDSDLSGVDAAPSENVVSLQMGDQPSFDAAKVEAIKSAIASGNFQINPNNIADGLISSTKELLAG